MDRSTYLHIDPRLCQSCSRCDASKVCRLKAIVQLDAGEQPYLDVDRCRDCRVCIPACPYGAVRKIQPNG
jgi:MinD superfamily P-loop ATPase